MRRRVLAVRPSFLAVVGLGVATNLPVCARAQSTLEVSSRWTSLETEGALAVTRVPPRLPPAFASRPADREGAADAAGAAALSALVPGAGQYRLGQRRTWMYLVLEAAGWIVYVDRRAAGADLRDRYRDFAWTEARIQTGARRDPDFDYYETLTKWERSGAFDADPGTPGVQPESDPATFNGSVWSLATGLFFSGMDVPESDPRFQRALDFYGQRAYGSEFLWDWNGDGAAQGEFDRLIRRSDDRFKEATNVLGLVIVNHVVSAVDAFVSARSRSVSVESRIAPAAARGSRLRWSASVRVEQPW